MNAALATTKPCGSMILAVIAFAGPPVGALPTTTSIAWPTGGTVRAEVATLGVGIAVVELLHATHATRECLASDPRERVRQLRGVPIAHRDAPRKRGERRPPADHVHAAAQQKARAQRLRTTRSDQAQPAGQTEMS